MKFEITHTLSGKDTVQVFEAYSVMVILEQVKKALKKSEVSSELSIGESIKIERVE